MLVLDFVSTIRAGRGGLSDSLGDPGQLTAWAAEHADALGRFSATEAQWREIVALRQAVRALFARAVSPGPPSSADVDRLPGVEESLARVNAAARAVPRAPRLDWPDGESPTAASVPVGPEAARPAAVLAASAVEFLAGPKAAELRACPAPRCVLYFVKEHPRQEWCSTACGNRARAARHYHAHK